MPVSFEPIASLSQLHLVDAHGGSSAASFSADITQDPASPAFNNFRFACSVRSDNGGWDTGHINFSTRSVFEFVTPRRCRLRAFAHFLPLGTSSVRGNKPWAPIIDGPGMGSFTLTGLAVLLAYPAKSTWQGGSFPPPLVDSGLQSHVITSNVRRGTNDATRTRTRVTAPQILEHKILLESPVVVPALSVVHIVALCVVDCLSIGGGRASADFSRPGAGLNIPMAVCHFLDP
ncbi:MAG: hypothetical protein JNM07_03825 [Phycisphaerae bacterium]|nr:hypothetical protein [Phycisphaerae bacterium]